MSERAKPFWVRDNLDYTRPCIITCAINGVVAGRDQCPAIPYTADEIAAEARRAYEAGAAVVHLHARKPDGGHSYDLEDFRAMAQAVRRACPVILNFTTGALDLEPEVRLAPLRELRPELATLSMGSLNYAKYSRGRKEMVFDFVFTNPFPDIMAMARAMHELGVRPDLDCFDSGHIAGAYPLMDMGLLHGPLCASIVLGVTGGMPPTAQCLAHQVSLLPPGSNWSVTGISHDQWRLVGAAISLGGGVRVGLEDNFYLSPGHMAKSNGELVEKAARMVLDQGRQVADVDQARAILGLNQHNAG